MQDMKPRVVYCPRKHVYDAAIYASCPYCAEADRKKAQAYAAAPSAGGAAAQNLYAGSLHGPAEPEETELLVNPTAGHPEPEETELLVQPDAGHTESEETELLVQPDAGYTGPEKIELPVQPDAGHTEPEETELLVQPDAGYTGPEKIELPMQPTVGHAEPDNAGPEETRQPADTMSVHTKEKKIAAMADSRTENAEPEIANPESKEPQQRSLLTEPEAEQTAPAVQTAPGVPEKLQETEDSCPPAVLVCVAGRAKGRCIFLSVQNVQIAGYTPAHGSTHENKPAYADFLPAQGVNEGSRSNRTVPADMPIAPAQGAIEDSRLSSIGPADMPLTACVCRDENGTFSLLVQGGVAAAGAGGERSGQVHLQLYDCIRLQDGDYVFIPFPYRSLLQEERERNFRLVPS